LNGLDAVLSLLALVALPLLRFCLMTGKTRWIGLRFGLVFAVCIRIVDDECLAKNFPGVEKVSMPK
jgi:hypothetical protein